MTRIATLRGPSAIGMAKMIRDSRESGEDGISIYDEPVEVLSLMSSDAVDFAVLPTSLAVKMFNKGLDYRIAAVMLWGGLYVCGTDCGIKDIRDLRGKTLSSMAAGSPPELMLRHLISREGLVPDRDVLFEHSFPSHSSLAYAAAKGQTSLCLMAEPYLSRVVAANKGFKVLLDLSEQWRMAEGCLPAVTSFLVRGNIAGNGDVGNCVKALKESCDWAKANPGEAASLAVSLGIWPDARAVSESIPRSGFDVVPASEAVQSVVSFLASLYETAPDTIGKRIPDDFFLNK